MAYGFNDDKSKYEIKQGTVLWENSNTGLNAGFDAQTVELTDNHTNYDYVEVIVLNVPSGKLYQSIKFPLPAMTDHTLVCSATNFASVGGILYWCWRNVQFLQNSDAARKQAVFGNGGRVSIQAGSGGAIGTSTGATYCIPVAIIGYKYD